ncbi:site-specific recombinase [Denitratisoma sp. agr-D3]
MENKQRNIDHLAALIDRLRPQDPEDAAEAERNIRREVAQLKSHPDAATQLGVDLLEVLSLPHQGGFYGETGIHSAQGFWLDLGQRLSQRLLPEIPDDGALQGVAQRIFHHPDDHLWVGAVTDNTWLALVEALRLDPDSPAARDATRNLLDAIRDTSYRIAGGALDRELLRADPGLEQHESPFLAQNTTLLPLMARLREGGEHLDEDELRDVDVLLDQCGAALDRVRRKAGENGISIRLTYLLARLRQLIERLKILLDLQSLTQADQAVPLFKQLLAAEQTRHRIGSFVSENISLLARNITDHASRHGEHYITDNRADWWGMARSAAGGGVVIALMAMLKIKLALLHLPPLTEGIAFGLNYAIGFALIHLFGFTVATKQPAMTAAAIAATLEESRPREMEKLGDLAQNVVRTQFIAVLGNVGLALPVAGVIALLWPHAFGVPLAPTEKLVHMTTEIHPLHSGALFFAAVAGVGLFLSGLVSGFFDNQARYHQLAPRVAAWAEKHMKPQRARRLGDYVDTHYGAVLGNLFFGMYLGLMGALGNLTGLPVDIRHVAFSSANMGTVIALGERPFLLQALPWALAGVIGIALVNLAVSFTLALYVAMKSRRQGADQILSLAGLLLRRFLRNPFSFFRPPQA